MVSISRDNKGNEDSHLVKCEFGDISKIEKVYNCVVSVVKYIKLKEKL